MSRFKEAYAVVYLENSGMCFAMDEEQLKDIEERYEKKGIEVYVYIRREDG